MPFDLRETSCHDVLARVAHALDTHFDSGTQIRKRRSIGARTDRDTWVRIEARALDKLDGQGWGVEAAAMLQGVSMPAWYQGLSWLDHDRGVMWRADETGLITDAPIKSGGILKTDPELSEDWWATFNSSMNALAKHTTSRQAVSQERITTAIHRVFPGVDTNVNEWAASHADLAWANLTAPHCYFLDWEDWGRAPRGYDAASLWRESLALPGLAERVRRERAADLDSRSGKVARLYACAVILLAGPDYAGPLFTPAQTAATALATELHS